MRSTLADPAGDVPVKVNRQLSIDSVTLPVLVTVFAFLVLFWTPMVTLMRDWWSDPEAGHGLLLGPLSIWLAWKRGRAPDAHPQAALGLSILGFAIVMRYASGLAAELFTMRVSLMLAAAGLIVFYYGYRQILHWWLPVLLLGLSIPLPSVILGSLALPLQLQASRFGAAMLEWRHVPVSLSGNVIQLPSRSLFVTEACSGLRSLTALLALGTLMGGLWLRTPALRVLLVLIAIPVAMLLNGLRIFLTGFFVYYVSPALGDGIMHYTEGWALFAVAFLFVGFACWTLASLESVWRERRQ